MSAADRAGDGAAHEHPKRRKFDGNSPSEEIPSAGTGAEGVQVPSVTEALADELRRAYELDDRLTRRRFTRKLFFSADTGLWYKQARVFVPGDPRLKQKIMSLCHSDKQAGHGGPVKTLSWPEISGGLECAMTRMIM